MRELKKGMRLFRYSGGMLEYAISSLKKPNCKQSFSIKITYQTQIYCVEKNRFTWVKKSTKHFDYGWAKNIDALWKIDFSIEDYKEHGLPMGLSFTKSGALQKAMRCGKIMLKLAERQNDAGNIEEWKKELSLIRGQQSKNKSPIIRETKNLGGNADESI